jgi:hypothetical protein
MFTLFVSFFTNFSPFDEFFLRIFAKPLECWSFYCAVGVPADASNVVGISTISGIPFVAGLPSPVDVGMLLML